MAARPPRSSRRAAPWAAALAVAVAVPVAAALAPGGAAPPEPAGDGAVVGAGRPDGVLAPRRRGQVVLREGRLVGVQDESLDAVVRPDGSTAPGFPLPVGTVFFLAEGLFAPAADPQEPGGARLGTGRSECAVQPPRGLVVECEVTLELAGRGSLVGVETIDFTGTTPGEPLRAQVAVTGGTGELAGATGECALADRADHDVSGVSFYDCRLAQPVALLR